MGAWGELPRENDTALDHELHIFGCPGRDDLGPQDPDEQRYVAWLVTQLKSDFPDLKDIAQRSLRRMHQLLENEEWMDRWRDSEKMIQSLKAQIAALEKLST